MEPDQYTAERSATTVGLITLPFGLTMVLAPSRAARLLRIGDHPAALRAIGAADLALVPGLIAGRRRSQWMATRAALNLVIAAYCLRLLRQEHAPGAKVVAGAMVVATAIDSLTITMLRHAHSRSEETSTSESGS